MSELDQMEMDMLAAADTWFSQGLHLKLQRLIAVAREGERATQMLRRRSEEERRMLQMNSGSAACSPSGLSAVIGTLIASDDA